MSFYSCYYKLGKHFVINVVGHLRTVKHGLDGVNMALVDVSASLEMITEDRRTCTAHRAQLPVQIPQVFELG